MMSGFSVNQKILDIYVELEHGVSTAEEEWNMLFKMVYLIYYDHAAFWIT